MASFAADGEPPEPESDDEDESLLEPSSILRLLLQFVDPATADADRERAGTFLWDLSAAAAEATVLAAHAGALTDVVAAPASAPRAVEVAVGVLANVAGHRGGVLDCARLRAAAAARFLEGEDAGALSELARLLRVAASARPGDAAWAAAVAACAPKCRFVLSQSLDTRLVVRVLDLCFAARFLADASVWAAFCACGGAPDALLGAVLDAIDEAGRDELSASKTDAGSSGLDAALRVAELCAVGDGVSPRTRPRAVAALAKALTDGDVAAGDALTAAVALANLRPFLAELIAAAPEAAYAPALTRALEAALDDADADAAAAAALFLLALLGPTDRDARRSAALDRAAARGLRVPTALRGQP